MRKIRIFWGSSSDINNSFLGGAGVVAEAGCEALDSCGLVEGHNLYLKVTEPTLAGVHLQGGHRYCIASVSTHFPVGSHLSRHLLTRLFQILASDVFHNMIRESSHSEIN